MSLRLLQRSLLFAALSLGACAAAPASPPTFKGPGGTADNPVRVEKMSDEVDWIGRQRCSGGGRWQMAEQSVHPSGERGCMLDKFVLRCNPSGEPGEAWFLHCL